MYFYFFLFFCVFSFLRAETYYDYRLDDLNYIHGGGVSFKKKERMIKNPDKILFKNENFELYNQNYLYSRFTSQKGGVKQEAARKYSSKSILDSEFGFGYKKSLNQFSFFLAPKLYYQEQNNLYKTIKKRGDFEAIISNRLNTKIPIILERGRGYQRLDRYGLFFSGISNYVEFSFCIPKVGLKANVIGLYYPYNSSRAISEFALGNKLYGGSVFFDKVPFLRDSNLFFYRLNEPLQIAKKQTIFEKAKDFHPHGSFSYIGLETKSNLFRDVFSVEFGLIRVSGFRDMAEYSYQNYNPRTTTKAWLGYLQGDYRLKEYNIKTGFLYTSKDRTSRVDNTSNGYSGLLTDPRIFGGNASFLLMQSIKLKDNKVFADLYEEKKNQYENKGMEFFHLGYNWLIYKSIHSFIAMNYSLFEKGKGVELIFMPIYQPNSFGKLSETYFLLSVCLARVKPFEKETFIFDEIQRNAKTREYLRFYLSAGIKF